MGIQGLIPFLKDATEQINIRKYKGYAVAVDTYCWIHRGAIGCALELAKGEKTDQYVKYCLKFVNMLRSMDVKPVLVFDGRTLPAKKIVEASRRERRELYQKKGKQLLREGKASEARDCFTKCINVTPNMALEVMKAVRSLDVDCIVAPYEADAQLAYLEKGGIVQAVITEDSDLVAFGCKKVILKMDISGNGLEIDQSRLNKAMKIGDKFSVDKFRYMCILSGCDYLPSLPGIGLGKARKLFQITTNPDLNHVLKRLAFNLKMKITVPHEYIDGFFQANNTFLYQLAYDPVNKCLAPLNPYPPEVDKDSLDYAGRYMPAREAYQVALGNIDINTDEVICNFKPDTRKTYPPKTPPHLLSIWHMHFKPLLLGDQVEGDDVERTSTQGKELKINTALPKKVTPGIKRAREDDTTGVKTLSQSEMALMYGTESDDPIDVVPETPTKTKKTDGQPPLRKRNRFAIKKLCEDSDSPREIVHSRFFAQSSKTSPTSSKFPEDPDVQGRDSSEKTSPSSSYIHPKTTNDVRSETPRLCNENVDRTKVIDMLEKFQHSTGDSEDSLVKHDRKRNCDATSNISIASPSHTKITHVIPSNTVKKTPLSRTTQKKGAFSWSKRNKQKPPSGIQMSLSDSMKSLSKFKRTSSSTKLKWDSEKESLDASESQRSEDLPHSSTTTSQESLCDSQIHTPDQNCSQENDMDHVHILSSSQASAFASQDSEKLSSLPASFENNSYGSYSFDPLLGHSLSSEVNQHDVSDSASQESTTSVKSTSYVFIQEQNARVIDSAGTGDELNHGEGSTGFNESIKNSHRETDDLPCANSNYNVTLEINHSTDNSSTLSCSHRNNMPSPEVTNLLDEVTPPQHDKEVCSFELTQTEVKNLSEIDLTPHQSDLDGKRSLAKRKVYDFSNEEQESLPVFVLDEEDFSSNQSSPPRLNGMKRMRTKYPKEADENTPPSQSVNSMEGISVYFKQNTEKQLLSKVVPNKKGEAGPSKPCKASGLSKRKTKSPKTLVLGGQCTLMAFMKKKSKESPDRLPLSPSKLQNTAPEVFVL